MKLEQAYDSGYLYEKDDKTYLMLTCNECKTSEELWIIPQEGMIERECPGCGKINHVDLKYIIEEKENMKRNTRMKFKKNKVKESMIFQYECKECGWKERSASAEKTVHECPECGSNEVSLISTYEKYNHSEKGGTIKMTNNIADRAEALLNQAEEKLAEIKDQTVGKVGEAEETFSADNDGVVIEKSDVGRGLQIGASSYDDMEVKGKRLLRLSRG